jgi:hypothetical protein
MEPPALCEKPQPHWWWGLAAVVAPLGLLLIALLGVHQGAPIPLRVAAVAPRVALTISVLVFAVALARARKAPIQIATAGIVVSGLGYLMLMWLGT